MNIKLTSRNSCKTKSINLLPKVKVNINNVSRLHSTTSLAIRHIYPYTYLKEVKE